MVKIRLTSWSPGLDKVRLTKSIREAAGIPLDEAHNAVNRLLAGQAVELSAASVELAQRLVNEAHAMGVGAECPDLKTVSK
jgi:hypothetical protein